MAAMKDPISLLKKGAEELGLPINKDQGEAFAVYLAELKKWNRAYSLTSLKKDEEIIIKHFLDSMLYCKALPQGIRTVADIGSGPGFPGIPMKIICPHLRMHLVEPTQKKVLFLRHICSRLNFSDTEVISARVEDIEGLRVDAAVTRALFSIGDFINKASHILNDPGYLVLSKGPKLEKELEGIDEKMISQIDIRLPFLNLTRHLIVVKCLGHDPHNS